MSRYPVVEEDNDDFAPRPYDELFEAARVAAIRQFEVTLFDGRTVQVFAHFHDAGQGSPVGHLSFVLIDSHGHNVIDRVFSVHVWDELKEIHGDPAKTDRVHNAKHMLAQAINERRNPTKPTRRKHDVH